MKENTEFMIAPATNTQVAVYRQGTGAMMRLTVRASFQKFPNKGAEKERIAMGSNRLVRIQPTPGTEGGVVTAQTMVAYDLDTSELKLNAEALVANIERAVDIIASNYDWTVGSTDETFDELMTAHEQLIVAPYKRQPWETDAVYCIADSKAVDVAGLSKILMTGPLSPGRKYTPDFAAGSDACAIGFLAKDVEKEILQEPNFGIMNHASALAEAADELVKYMGTAKRICLSVYGVMSSFVF